MSGSEASPPGGPAHILGNSDKISAVKSYESDIKSLRIICGATYILFSYLIVLVTGSVNSGSSVSKNGSCTSFAKNRPFPIDIGMKEVCCKREASTVSITVLNNNLWRENKASCGGFIFYRYQRPLILYLIDFRWNSLFDLPAGIFP